MHRSIVRRQQEKKKIQMDPLLVSIVVWMVVTVTGGRLRRKVLVCKFLSTFVFQYIQATDTR